MYVYIYIYIRTFYVYSTHILYIIWLTLALRDSRAPAWTRRSCRGRLCRRGPARTGCIKRTKINDYYYNNSHTNVCKRINNTVVVMVILTITIIWTSNPQRHSAQARSWAITRSVWNECLHVCISELIQLVTVSSQSTYKDAVQPLQGFDMHYTITS